VHKSVSGPSSFLSPRRGTFHTIVSIAVTAASRLYLIACVSCTLDNSSNLLHRFWKRHRSRCDRDIKIITIHGESVVEKGALKRDETAIASYSGQKALLGGCAGRIPHSQQLESCLDRT